MRSCPAILPIRPPRRGLLLAVLLTAACGSPEPATAPEAEQAPPAMPPATLPTAPRAIWLHAYGNTDDLFPGMQLNIYTEGREGSSPVSTAGAQARSSNPEVVNFASSVSYRVTDTRGAAWEESRLTFNVVAAGTTTIHVTLGSASDSIAVRVNGLPSGPAALVVDSFTVLEFPSGVFFASVPLLKLREPTGQRSVHVTAVEFEVPGMRLLCRTSLPFAAGFAAHVNDVDSYLWGNDLIFVTDDALGGSEARARVFMRDGDGVYSMLEARAPVQRLLAAPPRWPESPFKGVGWTC